MGLTQASFVVGSVYLKSSLKYVDEQAGEVFHPIVYAFGREVTAGPILFVLSLAYAGASMLSAVPVSPFSSLSIAVHNSDVLPNWNRAPFWCRTGNRSLRQGQDREVECARTDGELHLFYAGSTWPARQDLWRVMLMGACMYLSQVRRCSAGQFCQLFAACH